MSMYDLPFFPGVGGVGDAGKDGVSPTISVENISGGHRLIIVDAAGRKTVDIMNGTEGPRGIQGEKGETGERGPQGETGATGSQGPKGDKGDTGAQGIQGETGPAGKDGTNGTDGTNGKSAFEYAQDGGYAGTEADFIALLANSVNKQNIALGIHSDGLLYLFIDGTPIGSGIALSTNTET